MEKKLTKKQQKILEFILKFTEENLKKESENKAKQIQVLGEEEKIENLLKLAKEKGVAYAVKVAQDMNDPYILDIFHDVLVREGMWKKFEK